MAADFTIMDHVSAFRLSYFQKYLGVTYFIWLIGQAGLDITDYHILMVLHVLQEKIESSK